MTTQVALDGLVVLGFLAGAGIVHLLHIPAIRGIEQRAAAELKRVEAWYAAHTTPAERALVDGVARAGLAALEARVGAVEAKLGLTPAQALQAVEQGAAAAGATPHVEG
jgi:hypothetical protein